MAIRVMDWYWHNSDQDGNRLLLLLALADYANEDGECFPGTTGLGKKARLKRTALKNILSDFERMGKIGIVTNAGVAYNGGKTNRYYLNEYRLNRPMPMPPLPAVQTYTLVTRKVSKRTFKDALNDLGHTDDPSHTDDLPSGHTDDRPHGHTSDPKPSLEPSSKPSDIYAPAEADAQAIAKTDESSSLKKEGEEPQLPAQDGKRKSSAKKKSEAGEPKSRTPRQLANDEANKRKIDALGTAYGVPATEPDFSLYLMVANALIKGGVSESEFDLYVKRIRLIARKEQWKTGVSLPALIGKARISEYVAARDAHSAQQKAQSQIGGMNVDPERLKALGWLKEADK